MQTMSRSYPREKQASRRWQHWWRRRCVLLSKGRRKANFANNPPGFSIITGTFKTATSYFLGLLEYFKNYGKNYGDS